MKTKHTPITVIIAGVMTFALKITTLAGPFGSVIPGGGGLLMGATLTQQPGLLCAVVSHVGIYDSLRTELEPNGEFNITEFGTVKDPQQFKALHAYSPYHRVVDGTRYPAVLLLTGDHDGRVNPFHSRKMVARLQAANRSKYPILLRTIAAAGHGMGTALDERVAEEADAFAFLFDQLGIKYKATSK
jgi:prolyl oligopeptidase